MRKCSVDLVTGFLSAGKTTFINSVINNMRIKEDVIIVQCEKGLTAINSHNKNITIKELATNDEFNQERLMRMIKFYSPKRIIIECNGVGSTKKILEMLNSKEVKSYVRVGVVVNIIDCITLNTFLKNIPSLILPNIQVSNIIILNKCSNISNQTIESYISIIENLNLHGHILKCTDKEELSTALEKNNIISKLLG